MSILLKHIGKNIWENKFRSLVIILIVLLSTAVSFVVFHLQDIITYNFDKVYNASIGEANVTIRQVAADTPYLPESLNLENVGVEKRSDIYPFIGKYDSGQAVMKTMLIGMNLDDYQNMDAVSLLNAPDGFTLRPGECVISKKSADKFGLAVGDSMLVTVKEQDYAFQVAAIAESNRTFYEEKGNIQLLIPLKDANAMNQTSGMVTKTRLKIPPEDSIAAVIETLQEQNNDFSVYEKEEYESLHYQLSTVSNAMLIVVMIVILIGVYILFSLVKLIMMDRLPNIGTFRSVGADRAKIIGVLLLEFFSYGFIGTVLGLLLAVPLLSVIADLFNQYKEFGVATEVTYHLVYAATAACIGLLLPAVSALLHIFRISKIPLKDIILKPSVRSAEASSQKVILAVSVLAVSVALFFINRSDNLILGFVGLICLICGSALITPVVMTAIGRAAGSFQPTGSLALGLKNLASDKTVRGNGSMLVVVILIVMMMITVITEIKYIAASDLSDSGYEVIVTLNGEDITASDLKDLPSVNDAYDSYEFMWYGDYSTGFARVYGVDDFDRLGQFMKGLRQHEGSDLNERLKQTEHGIIIDQYWARVQSLSVGDVLSMYADEQHMNKIGDFTVAGFWDSSKGTTDRAFVAIGLNDFKSLFSDIPERILIQTAEPDKVALSISEKYMDTNISSATMEEFLSEQMTAINTMLGILLASVLLGSAIILFGIVSNLIVSFMQRKREYAGLYSVCMSKRQLIEMLLWEMVFSSIAIWIVSAASSFALSKFLTKAASGAGMALDYRINPMMLLAVIVCVFVIQGITTAFPIRKLKKLNIVEELKYE